MTRAEEILSRHGANLPWERGRGRDTWTAALSAIEEALSGPVTNQAGEVEGNDPRWVAKFKEGFNSAAPIVAKPDGWHPMEWEGYVNGVQTRDDTTAVATQPATSQEIDIAVEMGRFEETYPFTNHTKHRDGEVIEGRVRYAEPYVDKMFSAWLGGRQYLAATPTPPTLSEDLQAIMARLPAAPWRVTRSLLDGFGASLEVDNGSNFGNIGHIRDYDTACALADLAREVAALAQVKAS